MADLDHPDAAAALARYYDLDLEDDPGDLDMYLAFAEATDGPILELMAGSGRLAIPLAAAGRHVTAVDLDAAMLARAAALWQRTRDRAVAGGALDLVKADVTTLELKDRFDLVVVALNSVLLLDGRDAQRKLFDVVARHLRPDGRAVIDVWLPTPDDLRIYDGRLILDWVRSDDETGKQVAKSTSARYSTGARTASITTFFDAWRVGSAPVRTMHEDTITFTTADELNRFAADAGLIVETIGGDYEMGHFDGESDRVVMVCRAATR